MEAAVEVATLSAVCGGEANGLTGGFRQQQRWCGGGGSSVAW